MAHDVPGLRHEADRSAQQEPQRLRSSSKKGNKDPQTTSTIVMVEPAFFHLNFQTAGDNNYQLKPDTMSVEEFQALTKLPQEEAFARHPGLQERKEAFDKETHEKASQEFAAMVAVLRSKMIEVIAIPDVLAHDTPDSIFPNNPISTHHEGEGIMVKYPMRNENRRPEKQLPIAQTLASLGFKVGQVIDFSGLEASDAFNEGTGSMVLDRTNRITYASLSQRTTSQGVAAFAETMEYKAITFTSVDRTHDNGSVYHANVVMSVGEKFAVICSEAIMDETERETVLTSLRETGKDIIEITAEQMNGFAGNILEVRNTEGSPIIVMSETAHDTFTEGQLEKLGRYGEVVSVPIPTIEKFGGGSARCMMLEVHNPKEERH
ncbi:MAG: arginine deiminase-related protein [Candidatus Peregrinibacteria bacterium]|nr:arginine deiminase-related protein [Candidatus Peregrinibacteria bacterium]